MQMVQTVTALFRVVGARVRRDVIAYAICAVCGIAAIIFVTWASLLALLDAVGPIYAHLVVAGVYLAIALATVLWLQRAKSQARPASPLQLSAEPAPQQQLRFAQLAMIVEALLLGYSLSRRSGRR
jgi:hypothetical protein